VADREPYIDAHSHIWTPDVAHYPLAEGFIVENMNPRSFTAEELLALCRPAGVGRVNLIQMSFYQFDDRSGTSVLAEKVVASHGDVPKWLAGRIQPRSLSR
jgi:predicted TIM-barrel fold metal-dependent hydrolase